MLGNLKRFFKENQNDLILIGGVVLISLISFGAGRLTAPASVSPEPIVFENGSDLQASALPSIIDDENIGGEEGNYVASKNGTKYHLPWCSGAQRIKEENKIWFETREEAEKLGYSPAANCPGL